MTNRFGALWLVSAGVSSLATMAAPATAQDTGSSTDAEEAGLMEIVVTAQRRDENSQQVPLSIQTVTGETIEKSGYTDVTDLQYLVPGVQYDPTQGAAFQIRGVGTTSFDFSNAKSVNVVVDEVVMDGQRANGLIGMVDIERVEVLMGPQGTLFGKNSTSGVISVATGTPRLGVTSVRANANYGEHNDYKLNATLNLPLGDTAALRISGFDQGQDGFGRNVTLDKLVGSVHQYGGRAKLYVEPNDRVNFTLAADYAHHWDSSVRTPVDIATPGVTELLNQRGVFPGPENADTADSNYGEIETEEWGTSVRFNLALGDHSLRSISAYRQTRYNNNTPANLLPVDVFAYAAYNLGRLRTEKISQEFHLVSPQDRSITYMLGLFYNRLEARQTQYQWIAAQGRVTPQTPVLVASTGAIGESGNTSLFNATNETMAAFGQMQFRLSDALRLTLGARYTRDNNWQSLSYLYTDPVPIVGFQPVFMQINEAPVYPEGRAKGENFSWRVAPEYHFADNAMLYASYSTGYKPKGIAFVGSRYAPYEDETVEAWELGLKSEWFGRRLRFNINAFRSTFTDFQATILTPVPDGLGNTILATAIGNAGGLRSQGVETTLQVRPVPALTLGISGTYTDAKFTDYVYNDVTDYTGTRLPNAPKWAFTATADLDQPVGNGLRLKGHADYAWRDRYWTVVGQPDYSYIPSFGLANVRLSVAAQDDRFEAGVYARNLFDTYFSTGWQLYGALGLLHYTSPNARRTAGVFVSTRF